LSDWKINMPETGCCPQCGAELPADAPQGLCPKCLLQLGFESQARGSAAGDSAFAKGPTATAAGPHAPPSGAQPPTTPYQRAGSFVPPTPAELAPRFPQLEILELLGQGGMGAVYKARQPALDRLVALKILPPDVGQDPAFGERFTREARALARLSHQNIVTVHDFGQADGLYYFLMEYIDGANLRQTLSAGKLAPREALAIVPQICEALQYAHDEGVVHRDIKPENILLDRKGRVKIADFGLAKVLGQPAASGALTGSRQVMGTPYYMAPEQMDRPQEVDHRADIYSLGVVFYEMLTGELPLGRFAPPSRKVHVDVRLDEIVLRALESEPGRRYQHASDVKSEVERISRSPQPPPSPPPSPPPERPVAALDEADLEEARDQVRGPAIGLLVVGVIQVLVFGGILMLGLLWFGAAKGAEPMTHYHGPSAAVEQRRQDRPADLEGQITLPRGQPGGGDGNAHSSGLPPGSEL
jgi:predicted Ser/Thr protein kinase